MDADQRDALEVGIPLDDLVRDPGQRALDRLGIENDFRLKGVRGQPALRALLTVDSFPASLDRVKGVVIARECTRWVGRRLAIGHGDQPLLAVVHALRQLALRALETLHVLLVVDQVERGDVPPADLLER